MSTLLYSNTALLLIDWQERLFPAMPEQIRDRNLKQTTTLKWLAEQESMPVIVSEQYPKGLGPTVASLGNVNAIAKTHFSAMKNTMFCSALEQTKATNIILTGMETHICVAQTCVDLCAKGYTVWVPADAVLSRRKLDWQFGLQRMQNVGAKIVSAEAILFELLQHSKDANFKQISRLIR